MKEFDHTGLLLAEYQGKLFEKSTELNCSSAVFFEDFYKDYEDGIVEISFVYRLRNSLAHYNGPCVKTKKQDIYREQLLT